MTHATPREELNAAFTMMDNLINGLTHLEGIMKGTAQPGATDGAMVLAGQHPVSREEIMQAFHMRQAQDGLLGGMFGGGSARKGDDELYWATVSNVGSLRDRLVSARQYLQSGDPQQQAVGANCIYSDMYASTAFGTNWGTMHGQDAYHYAQAISNELGRGSLGGLERLAAEELLPPVPGVNFDAFGVGFERIGQAVAHIGQVVSDAVVHPEKYANATRGTDGRMVRGGDTTRNLGPRPTWELGG